SRLSAEHGGQAPPARRHGPDPPRRRGAGRHGGHPSHRRRGARLMQPTDSRDFRKNATVAMANPDLQAALGGMEHTFVAARARAAARLPEFEALRDAAKAIKDHALANLDFYLERFADNVEAAGGKVHWCADGE